MEAKKARVRYTEEFKVEAPRLAQQHALNVNNQYRTNSEP